MKNRRTRALLNGLTLLLPLLPIACGGGAPPDVSAPGAGPPLVSLAPKLGRLIDDFNAMDDKVRMLFISGPSCGICLRGMDDLNRSIVASVQADPRVHTLVVHVPTLGAEEKHAIASLPLMSGPRVSHYWDGNGGSGIEFQDALGIDIYAWDVWMIYEPGARWEAGQTPPAPAFWQHQLGSLSRGSRLDADVFAREVTTRLAALPAAPERSVGLREAASDPGLLAVAQPRGYMIQQNHESRGGYRRLKAISGIDYAGTAEVGGHRYALSVSTRRPAVIQRTVEHAAGSASSAWDGEKLQRSATGDAPPDYVPDELLRAFEFDGWMTDWKAKGHQVWRLGMRKEGERLPWVMEAELANGQTWHIFVDSHSGDAYRWALINGEGGESVVAEFADFRDADGYRLPHAVRYYRDGELLAIERFDDVTVSLGRAAGS